MDSDKTLTGARVLVLAREGAELGGEGGFSALLEGIGCRSVGIASSALDAWQLANDLATRPDLAVVDLGSSSEAFDVCALARQLGDAFGIVPVIAMSRSDIGRMNEAISARPSGYLNKPFSQATLKEVLLKALPDRKPVEVPMNVPSASPSVTPSEKGASKAIELGAGVVGAAGVALASAGLGSPVGAAKAKKGETIEDTLKSLLAEPQQEKRSTVEAPGPILSSPTPSKLASAIPAALPAAPAAGDPNAHKRAARGQQLQGLGYLGRGFAHEFNNLLTVLIGNLSLAQDRYEGGAAMAGQADEDSELSAALGAAERGRRMVQQLLTFAEGGQPVRDVVRIADLARTVLGNHRESHPSVFFQFQCSEPDLKISVDRDQVSRLLENLVTNAVQALPAGGTVIVRLLTTTDAKVDGGQSGLEYLLMEVIDTGVGMDEETLKHAFDPYFTTRGDTNATGIGLTVCESIAKSHGGFLVLQSKPGRGTIATFHLPMNAATARPDIFQLRDSPPKSEAKSIAAPQAVDSPMEDIEAAKEIEGIPGLFGTPLPDFSPTNPLSVAGAAASGGHGQPNEFGMVDEGAGRRVLVMEDDAMIRRLVVRCLGRAGYDVVETTNGQDALDMHAMADAEGRRFDLILSDLTIEDGMGGIEMMQLLRQRDAKIRAVVSSGYADSPAMARPAEYGFDAVLPKPYPPRELLRSVAETLAGEGVRGR